MYELHYSITHFVGKLPQSLPNLQQFYAPPAVAKVPLASSLTLAGKRAQPISRRVEHCHRVFFFFPGMRKREIACRPPLWFCCVHAGGDVRSLPLSHSRTEGTADRPRKKLVEYVFLEGKEEKENERKMKIIEVGHFTVIFRERPWSSSICH